MSHTVSLEALTEAAVEVDRRGQFVGGNRLAAEMFGSPGPKPAPIVDAIVAVEGFSEWLRAPGPERPGQSGRHGPERPSPSGRHGPERPGQSGRHGPERPGQSGTTDNDEVFRTHLRAWRQNGVPLTIELAAKRLDTGGALCLLIELDREQIAYEARQYFDAAFDAAPIGMGLFNTDGEYARVNAALCRLLGRPEHELLGQRDQQFTHPDDREADVDAAWRILRGEIHTWQCEKRFVRPDGSIVWAIANLTFLRDAAGNPISWLGQFQDITERKQLEVDLRAREHRTGQILQTAHNAFIAIDERGLVTEWNRQAETMFGWGRQEVIGRELAPLIVPERFRTAHCQGIEQARESGTGPLIDALTELVALRRDGREFPVEVTVSALKGERGHSFNAFVRDISERKRTEEELAQAHATAVEASRMKSEFLANMSHEIRTPLNGIMGMTGLLLGTELDREQREFAETARHSGEALLEIVNDVLDFSKIEAGKLELERSNFDIGALVEDVAEMSAAEAQRKGLEITVMTRPEVPAGLTGDPGRIRQVVTNLVGNAVKFTDAGEVAIEVSMAGGGDRPLVRIDVRDTGVGVAPDDLARIFQSFTQADASTTRRYGGTGLGLAICKRLCEMMGGTIWAESARGRGSTFSFTARLDLSPDAATPSPGRAPAAPGARRVLIADDNATTRGVLERQLAGWGVETVVAEDGHAALGCLQAAAASGPRVDLALVDSDMPGMDGLEVARAVTQDAALSDVPLIMLTPLGFPRSAGEGQIAAYLTKPVRQSQLFDAMASVLAVSAVAAPQEPLRYRQPRLSPLPAGLRLLVAEDNAVNQKVIAAMLTRLGFQVDLVADGREALDALDRIPYSAVLMDCQMPEMNGYQATGEIRRRESSDRHTPIVALTASALKGDAERCLAAGMDAYLSKPVSAEALEDVLRRLLAPADNGH